MNYLFLRLNDTFPKKLFRYNRFYFILYYTVSFRFDLFRFASISFRFGRFRFVSFRYISFHSLQVPQFPQYYLHVFSSLVLVTPRGFIVYISQITAVSMF